MAWPARAAAASRYARVADSATFARLAGSVRARARLKGLAHEAFTRVRIADRSGFDGVRLSLDRGTRRISVEWEG